MPEQNAHLLSSANAALSFMTAGKATVTLRSAETGNRFTYRIKSSDDGKVHFVSLMQGTDNESSFSYLGTIRGDVFYHGKKSKIAADAPAAKAFAWAFNRIAGDKLPGSLEVWHEGRCGRCGRKLTVPESIESGLGPECANMLDS